MKQVLVLIVVIVLMAGSGGAGYYFGNDNGFKQAQNIRAEFFQQRLGTQGTPGADAAQGQQGGQRSGGQAGTLSGRPTASGTVKSVQGNTITVTQPDGSTTTVIVDDKTTISKQATGTIADVQAGLRIVVTEQNGTKRIQLTPAN